MDNLYCYNEMPIWDKDSIPEGLKQKHNTKIGTWAKLTVLKGTIDFDILDENDKILSQHHFTSENQPPFIEPQQWHRIVGCSEDTQCQLRFFCTLEDYFNKKYELTKTHSEVVEAMQTIKPCSVLDLGCGSGRNSLYLSKLGFDVTAYDKNSDSIAKLNDIAKAEQITNIKTKIYDINESEITDQYDLIISTVVLMFLNPKQAPSIIKNMQEHTEIGGYNLIVSAMDTAEYPCNFFPFPLKEGELKHYYQDWNIIKYNENIGQLHRLDENGNRITLRFATMLAQK